MAMKYLVHDTNSGKYDVAKMSHLTEYKRLIRKALFLGSVFMLVLSGILSQIAALRKNHLKDLLTIIKYTKNFSTAILFQTAKPCTRYNLEICCNANVGSKKDKAARAGVARSSSTPEILATAEQTYLALYIRKLLEELKYAPKSELITVVRNKFAHLKTTRAKAERFLSKMSDRAFD
eukprot:IDg10661t1